MLDKTVGLSEEEATRALQSLAKLHALSHIVVESGAVDIAKILPENPNGIIAKSYIEGCIEKLINVIRKTWPKEW